MRNVFKSARNIASRQRRRAETLYVTGISALRNESTGGGIIIIGCGRSGTTYTARLFSSIGYAVGHERLHRHGIASWYLASDQSKVPVGPSMGELRNLSFPIVHQVRHPLQTISSATVIGSTSRAFLESESSIYKTQDPLLLAMRYWYWWNLQSGKRAVFTYKVEDLETNMPKLLRLANMRNKDSDVPEISKRLNAGAHPAISWQDCENKDPVLTARIKELSFAYGYFDL